MVKKVIFIRYSLLEELEATNKGNVSSEQILTLVNKKKYKLEEAVIFKEKLEGDTSDNFVGKIITISEMEKKGYDLYMDTVIINNSVYRVEEGFKGTLIEENTTLPKVDEFEKQEKTSEQLLADLMLGNML